MPYLKVSSKSLRMCQPLCLCHRSRYVRRVISIAFLGMGHFKRRSQRGLGFDEAVEFPSDQMVAMGGSTRVQGV